MFDERKLESLNALGKLIGCVDKHADGAEIVKGLYEDIGFVKTIYGLKSKDLQSLAGLSWQISDIIDLIDDVDRFADVESFGAHPVFRCYSQAAPYLRALMYGRRIEYCYLLCLNARGRLISCEFLQKGTVDSSAVYVREVALTALRQKAVYAVMSHNHPGGSMEASPADIAITHDVMEALRSIGVTFLDHIIVGKRQSMSVRALGVPSERIWRAQKPKDRLLTEWFETAQ